MTKYPSPIRANMQSPRVLWATQAAPHSSIFRRMPHGTGGKPFLYGDGRKNRCIARTAGNHHFGAFIERPIEGLRAHHSDDVFASVNDLLIKGRRRFQRFDLALGQLFLQILFLLFGVDDRQFEMELLLPGDLLGDLHGPGQIDIASGGAGRADQ